MSDKTYQSVGPAIRVHRERLGLAVTDLANLADTAPNRVYDWENGVHIPTLPVLQRITDAFGLTVSELLRGVM